MKTAIIISSFLIAPLSANYLPSSGPSPYRIYQPTQEFDRSTLIPIAQIEQDLKDENDPENAKAIESTQFAHQQNIEKVKKLEEKDDHLIIETMVQPQIVMDCFPPSSIPGELTDQQKLLMLIEKQSQPDNHHNNNKQNFVFELPFQQQSSPPPTLSKSLYERI